MPAEPSILVVDDELDIAELLADLLASRGYSVATASNGLVGMSLLMSNRFDLVITDFMMPVMDGLEMVRSMRAEERLADVPVIIMSAQAEAVYEHGDGLASAVLQKPFRPKTLFDEIERVLAAST